MASDTWSAVDSFFGAALFPDDPALQHALTATAAAGLPSINVSPAQGKFLHLQARAIGARRILEIGTLGGYSTIWMARALGPGGRLITLEIDPAHAAVARANLAEAGAAGVAEVRVGPALQTLATMQDEEPFDLVFIDADKVNNADYFTWALRLSHPGTVIMVDNVVRSGAVADPTNADPSVEGVRRLNAVIAAEPRVSATVLQTVGSKGYDGFLFCVVGG